MSISDCKVNPSSLKFSSCPISSLISVKCDSFISGFLSAMTIGIAASNSSTKNFNFYYTGFATREPSNLLQIFAYFSASLAILGASIAAKLVFFHSSVIVPHSSRECHIKCLFISCLFSSSKFSKFSCGTPSTICQSLYRLLVSSNFLNNATF